LADRFINMFIPRIRNRSWKMCGLIGLFFITLSNCSIFIQDLGEKKIHLKELLIQLANLLAPVEVKAMDATPKIQENKFHLIRNANGITKMCVHCASKKSNSTTCYYCSTCNVFLHANCFEVYHNLCYE